MRDKNSPVLFLNLCCGAEVKWKLFYDAKTMFVSALCPLDHLPQSFFFFGESKFFFFDGERKKDTSSK